MILDDIKIIKSITTTDQDDLINIFIRKAVTLIKNYIRCADTIDISATYPDAVIEYVIICLNRRGNEGLKQFGQGSRSGTYESSLPDSVMALLPAPYAKLIDTSYKPVGVTP